MWIENVKSEKTNKSCPKRPENISMWFSFSFQHAVQCPSNFSEDEMTPADKNQRHCLHASVVSWRKYMSLWWSLHTTNDHWRSSEKKPSNSEVFNIVNVHIRRKILLEAFRKTVLDLPPELFISRFACFIKKQSQYQCKQPNTWCCN